MGLFSDKGDKHRLTLTGDWWYFAGALKMLLTRRGIELTTEGQEGNGWVFTLPGWPQDTVHITSFDNKTTIVIIQRHPESAVLWQDIKAQLEDMATYAREMRRDVHGPTGEEVIEIYYRARAAGGRKVTLKQLAEQYGFNVTYLSQAKRIYDAAGKWGAKAQNEPK
jgi:hypothetical protein